MSVESTYPSVRVLSEVKSPSNPRPAIPIASCPFLSGGARSIATTRSSPRSPRTSAASCAQPKLPNLTSLPASCEASLASNPGTMSAGADSARSTTARE